MKTRNRRVYAIGDAAGAPCLTHLARYHAELVVKDVLLGGASRLDLTCVPRVLYTEPELAEIGLSEAEAIRRGRKTAILRWPFADNDRSQAERGASGFVKLIAGKRGRLLGAAVVGEAAGELIATLALLRDNKLTVGDLSQLVLPYPTRSEALKRAAMLFQQPLTKKPFLRRLIARLGGVR